LQPNFTHFGPTVSRRLKLARRAIAAKDWVHALSELNTAAREESRNAEVHNLLGYSQLKQPAEAEKHLAVLEQLNGNKTCEENVDLAQALSDYRAENPG
jgi:Flp pilus assembly protein TadD